MAREDTGLAARLLGAAEAMRGEMGVPVPPYDRAEHDRNGFALRKALGKRTLALAWAEGKATTREQAVEKALRTPREH